MDRFRSLRRVQIQQPESHHGKVEETSSPPESHHGDGTVNKPANVWEGMGRFMGIKVRRRASLQRDCKGDYLDVPGYPSLNKLVTKQGDVEKTRSLLKEITNCRGNNRGPDSFIKNLLLNSKMRDWAMAEVESIVMISSTSMRI